MDIFLAGLDDLHEIMDLQLQAYQSEARLLNNFSIPPLKEKLSDLEEQFQNGVMFLKAVDAKGTIIGSVRGGCHEGTVFIGKLMVAPAYQGMGLGKRLLNAIEEHNRGMRYELFTSNKSVGNILFYEKAGYKRFKEREADPGLTLIFLEKRG